MIVDLHTRIWESANTLGEAVAARLRQRRTEPWQSTAAPFSAHAEATRPVAVAVLLGFESELLNARIDDDTVAAWVARAPDRLIGFAGIDPTSAGVERKLQEALDAGLSGVTISPSACDFHPHHTRAMTLFEACEAHGLPVLIETLGSLATRGTMEYGRPALLDEVARSFPRLHLIVGSMGDPWHDEAAALAAKHERVWLDTADVVLRPWALYGALLEAHGRGVMDRVLLGSGFPFCLPERAILSLYSVNTLNQGTHLPGVPREQLRALVERDTLSLLGLTPEETAGGDERAVGEAGEGGAEVAHVEGQQPLGQVDRRGESESAAPGSKV